MEHEKEKGLDQKHVMEHFQHPDKFGEWMGYRIEGFDTENKKAVTGLSIREDHLSPAGKVHGGVISGFLDYACGAAVFTTMGKGDFCSTVELKVNYLRPINLGDEIKGKTAIIFEGKKICVVHGFIYVNDSEKPSAMVTGTFNLVRAK
ncbi:MAG: PaaI family thioesterase [Flavobacteriales bacterium]|nr:PaaI family thioesterase [Flavobacteriales bacterium]